MDLMKYLARVRDERPARRGWYVSPTGSPSGDGSFSNPWDIVTALEHPAEVQPGDTIWLRGGTYYGAFVSSLTGTAAKPIIVRNYAGERVTFDSNYETTLAADINSSQTSFAVTDISKLRMLKSGDWIYIGGSECVQVFGVSGNTITSSTRGFGESDAAAHLSGAQVRKTYGNVEALRAEGGYTWFWGIEFFCTSTERINAVEIPSTSNPYWRPASSGVSTVAGSHGIRFINCVIHDGPGGGIGSFSGSDGIVFYGNLLYNMGWDSPGSRHGRAIYTQNNDTTKTYKDNIILSSFRDETTTRMGGSGTAYNNDFVWEGNIFGSGGVIIGDGAGFNDITWRDNYTYKGAMGFGNIGGNTGTNVGLTVDGSYFGGGWAFYFCSDVTATGNTIRAPLNPYGGATVIRFLSGTFADNLLTFAFSNNEYAWTSGVGGTWSTTGPPNVWKVGSDPEQNDSFPTWQARPGANNSHLDYGSVVTSYTKDTSVTPNRPSYPNAHFLRVNEYDPNRAHLVIYNWDRDNDFVVPDATLADFLSNGDSYRIRNAQDYYTDTWTGTYDGTSITIDMVNRTLAPIHGFDVENSYNGSPTSWVTTFPEFGVFVIERI